MQSTTPYIFKKIMTIPLDSSDLNNQQENQSSPPQSEPSSTPSYFQLKEKLLLGYQDKATDVLETLKECYPSFSLLDGQNVLLILFGLIAEGNKRKAAIMMLSDNLDAELKLNGILPEPTEQEDSSPVLETP